MENILLTSGYVFNQELRIWARPDYTGINYSDGDEAEQRIASIVDQVADITVLSTELRQHCADWASLYHLSSTRANIMRPFENLLKGDVLEIGAGCGAITRYLGECGANVLALEGSPRRAAIARSRTRELENVTVLAEKFDQFQCDHQFEVITLIGVLEYSNLFTSEENPPLAILLRLRSLLKPEGKLIIAIENQLGLKYFAGAPEDHLGQPMVGIEGRYRKDQPQTFGRKVLTGLLEQAGFASPEFLAPFPDYKFPVSILTEDGFSNKNFDAAAFAWQSARRDPQLPAYCNFSLELAWPEVFRNELGLDVANSFLIIASPDAKQFNAGKVLAYHYSVDRIPIYCKETVFIRNNGSDIHVKYRCLGTSNEDAEKANNPLIKFILPDSDKYVYGRPLSLEFISIVTKDGWSFDQVARFIWRYLSIVETFAKSANLQVSMASPYAELSGGFFDVVPQNIIICEDGRTSLIDTEWLLAFPIEVAHLLFRSLLLLINSITRFGRPASQENITRHQFIDGVFAAAGLRLHEGDYARYITLEADILQSVTGQAAENYLTWGKDQPLPILSLSQALAERDGQITGLIQAVAERDMQIVSLNQAVIIRDGQIASLRGVINDKNVQSANLEVMILDKDTHIADLSTVMKDKDNSIYNLQAHAETLESNLNAICSTRGWRLLTKYYKIRNILLQPVKRTQAIVMSIGSANSVLLKAIRYYNNYGLKNFVRKVLAVMRSRRVSESAIPKGPIKVAQIPIRHSREVDIIPTIDSSVSIIIPTLNAGPAFPFLLDMLVNQKGFVETEIVLVDSGSKDGTIEAGRRYGAKILEIPPARFSHSYARNLGAEHAKGKYLLFTVQDALPPTCTWLYELLTSLRNSKVAAVSCTETMREDCDLLYRALYWNHCRFLELDKGDRILSKNGNNDHAALRKNGQLSDVACLIPRELFLTYKYRYNYAEDLDLGIRLVQDGHKLSLLSSVSIIHSHNRPASYYLKRWYVETLTLPTILPDMPVPSVTWDSIIADILLAHRYTSYIVNTELAHIELPCKSDTFIRAVLDVLENRSFQDIHDIGKIHEEAYVDNEFKAFIASCISLTSDSAKSSSRHQLATPLINIWKMILEYVGNSYEVVDEEIAEDLKDSMYKSYALVCGNNMAFCSLGSSREPIGKYEKLHASLIGGI